MAHVLTDYGKTGGWLYKAICGKQCYLKETLGRLFLRTFHARIQEFSSGGGGGGGVQVSLTKTALTTLFFLVIFQGGGGVRYPCPPSGSALVFDLLT